MSCCLINLKIGSKVSKKSVRNIRKPIYRLGTFSDTLNEILGKLGGRLAPTFLFVDPCGVSGASFDTIRAVMANEECEAFIFFNIDGVRRIAGLSALSPVLVELMGDEARARALYEKLRNNQKRQGEREEIILFEYRRVPLKRAWDLNT